MTEGGRTPLVASLWRFDAATVTRMAAPHDVRVVESRAGAATVDLVRDADVVLADPSGERPLTGEIIKAMRRCRLIQQPSVGVDSIDIWAAAARGIAVANTAGTNSQAVAEWVIMAATTLLRDAHRSHAAMTAGDWPVAAAGRELGSLTLGLVGMGNTARAVASILCGFGSTVLFHHHRPLVDVPPHVFQMPLDELLSTSDVVSLHVPLTAETRGLLDADRLALMKRDAVLVNSSRGAVVDEAALGGWLAQSPARRAALDVFATEPLPRSSPLRGNPQVLLSPHVAAGTTEARQRRDGVVADNLRRALSGQAIRHRVDVRRGQPAGAER